VGRPPLPVGTYGKIHYIRMEPGQVQARTRFRDFDGTRSPSAAVPRLLRPRGRASLECSLSRLRMALRRSSGT
jgi:hypothetical protein